MSEFKGWKWFDLLIAWAKDRWRRMRSLFDPWTPPDPPTDESDADRIERDAW
jgi:hypothetical protein